MLFDAANVKSTVQALKRNYPKSSMPRIVIDPVSVSTSGHSLLDPTAIDIMTTELFPLAAIITPNIPEAQEFLSRTSNPYNIDSIHDMVKAAREISPGAAAVLIKGGHITATISDVDDLLHQHPDAQHNLDSIRGRNTEILKVGQEKLKQIVMDVLYQPANGLMNLFVRPYIESRSTHGTGCTLSAAIACFLARGEDVVSAVERATWYTHHGIASAFPVGKGNGPLNHMHLLTRLPTPRPTTHSPYPTTKYLIDSNPKLWNEYVEHRFTRMLGAGTLPTENFLRFMIADYHYLKYYARAYSLLAAKSHSFPAIQSALNPVTNILLEISTHRSLCAKFGVSAEEMERSSESAATLAYGCYLVDVGMRGDASLLLIALLACLLGYGEVGLYLKKEAEDPSSPVHLEGNPYREWIEDYSGEHYQGAVRSGLETIEKMAQLVPPSEGRLKEWREVWERCTWLERNFWDSAMDPKLEDRLR